MKRKQIIGLVVASALFVVTGVTSVFTHAAVKNLFPDSITDEITGTGTSFEFPSEPFIAVVPVVGTIEEQFETSVFETSQSYQHDTTMDYIDCLIEDPDNTGIMLYIDSPGGTVYEAEELYNKLREYSDTTGRPIWAYMAHMAASGGYMAAVAADYIAANLETTTGSIGVIMSAYDMSGLYEKLGIRYISITSGPMKDSSNMNDDQIAVYQAIVDEAYDRFVDKVADGRNMTREEVLPLADGRVYTATQAVDNGLIDSIDSYDNTLNQMMDELDSETIYELPDDENLFAGLFAKIESLIPKSEAQTLKEIAEEKESGVLMYYAE
ncbi:MAG: signal peptide peptidase SppA [Bariatricus sp.]|nr:signal peptide peptidase SppA [Bariatricus sp.]